MFIVVDGLDGIGKSLIIDEIVKFFDGKRILDLHYYWEQHHNHPDFALDPNNSNYIPMDSFELIVSSEPTHAHIGDQLRTEVYARNSRNYSAYFTAMMFAADREILYRRVHIPALKAGKIIVQSRCISTSIIYQSLQDSDKSISINDILSISGNELALKHAPSLLIIPTIKSADEIMRRLDRRYKKDNAIFETFDFQMKLKPYYESNFLKEIFESRGTTVKYLDAGISVESTRAQARNIMKDFVCNHPANTDRIIRL
jgi:thymidylate kinase